MNENGVRKEKGGGGRGLSFERGLVVGEAMVVVEEEEEDEGGGWKGGGEGFGGLGRVTIIISCIGDCL